MSCQENARSRPSNRYGPCRKERQPTGNDLFTYTDDEELCDRVEEGLGVLVADGTDPAFVTALQTAVEKAGALLQVVAPKIGGANGKGGKRIAADHQLAGGPSILFDAVVVAVSADGAAMLEPEAAAIDWIRDAFGHLKVIGVLGTAASLLERAGIEADEGVVTIDGPKGVSDFIDTAKNGRVWDREPTLRTPA